VIEQGGCNVQTFHCAHDGDRWRDHPICVKQCSPKKTKQKEKLSAPQHITDQRRQYENSAFTAIIGTQNEGQIFNRDNQYQGPKDE